jgi:transposase InsO family protein
VGEGGDEVSVARFIADQRTFYRVPHAVCCAILGVSTSWLYKWLGRPATARQRRRGELDTEVLNMFKASKRTYGSPRIHADLIDAGVAVSERRVAELMAFHKIVGLSGREHSTVTTRRDRIEAPFPDLVKRGFRPATPNTVWYGDITYIWVGSRFWYLATVIDASSKMVIGWKLADHMRAELVVEAFHAAIDRRGGLIPVGLIFHSDRGSQYTGHEFQQACREYGVMQSMGRRGV